MFYSTSPRTFTDHSPTLVSFTVEYGDVLYYHTKGAIFKRLKFVLRVDVDYKGGYNDLAPIERRTLVSVSQINLIG